MSREKRPRVLFICGSLNQTTQHQIARQIARQIATPPFAGFAMPQAAS